jgi:hypothetical protein
MATTKHEEGKGVAGTAVGGPVGAAVGTGIGAVSGSAAGAAIDYESHEPEFRREFESSPDATSRKWEEVSPAYRYGWEYHDRAEYRGKSWGQVSSDLQKSWTGGQWSDYKPHVRSGWERRATHIGRAGGETDEPLVEEGLDKKHTVRDKFRKTDG